MGLAAWTKPKYSHQQAQNSKCRFILSVFFSESIKFLLIILQRRIKNNFISPETPGMKIFAIFK